MRPVLLALLTAAAVLSPVASARAADACPNAAFRVDTELPGCRAWEQVSPVDKHGLNAYDLLGSVATTGDRALFTSRGALADGDSGALASSVLSSRGAAWSSRGVDPPFDTPTLVLQPTLDVSDDLSTSLVTSTQRLAPGGVDGASNVYLRDLSDGTYRLAFTRPGTELFVRLAGAGPNIVVGESPDLEHFAFYDRGQLTADAPAGSSDRLVLNLYQWDSVGGLRLASVRPDGQPAPFGIQQPPNLPRPWREAHLLSTDGRRLTMAQLRRNDQSDSRVLVQRVDGQRTVLIGRSHRGQADPSAPVDVAVDPPWASPDGTQVTFAADTSTGPLTDASPADGFGRLYRWSADGDRLEDLLLGTTQAATANVAAIVRQSADGRYVWFTSYETLTDDAQPGTPNLFVLDTQARRLTFVAPVTVNVVAQLSWSPSGRRLALLSPLPLTGFDNADPSCSSNVDFSSLGRCDEVFTFDAAMPSAGVTCASCAAPATGNARIGPVFGPLTVAGVRASAVTEDGRVVFDTPSRLVPADVNRVADVYEAAPDGSLSLLTSGTSDTGAVFAQTTPSGDDVLFYTREPLVGQDTDDLIDLYDAREGGGLASQLAAVPAAPCEGDACRGATADPPRRPVPAAAAPTTRPAATFHVRVPTASARRSAARRGRLTVRVRVSTAGTVALRARARIGRRTRTVASARRTAERAATVTASLRLSKAARRQLRRSQKLRLTLIGSFTRVTTPQTVHVTLRRAATRRKEQDR